MLGKHGIGSAKKEVPVRGRIGAGLSHGEDYRTEASVYLLRRRQRARRAVGRDARCVSVQGGPLAAPRSRGGADASHVVPTSALRSIGPDGRHDSQRSGPCDAMARVMQAGRHRAQEKVEDSMRVHPE
ncbi:hypothetical protein [Variovorax boronicumulans]|uniref:hypothetical protein n=1 Tax=Variovorax boronicumulans TaxID=436515 RepID=UPI001C577C35